METKPRTIDISKLCKLIDRGSYHFDMAIQRAEGQWTNEQQSLLIDSIIQKYFIPAVWVQKKVFPTGIHYYVVDGMQRITTIYNYVNDKFKLHKSIESVTLKASEHDNLMEDTTFEIAGKKFSALPDVIQDSILDYLLDEVEMLGYTEEQIEEQFYRLNNGSTFTKAQKANVVLGGELATKIKEIADMPFWERTAFTNNQCRRGDITATILQCLMLMTNFEYKNFGANEVLRFADWYSENYKDEELNELKARIETLDEHLLCDDEINKFLKKINIPALIMNIELFNQQNNEITDEQYEEFLVDWVSTNAECSGYLENCGTGSTSQVKVQNRVTIINDWLKSYIDNIQLNSEKARGGEYEDEETYRTA